MVPQKESESVWLLLHLARGAAKGVLCWRHPDSFHTTWADWYKTTWEGRRTLRSKDTWGVLGRSQLRCQDTAGQLCCWVPLQGEGGGGWADRPGDRGEGGEDAVGLQVRQPHHGHHHLQALHLPCLALSSFPGAALSCLCLEVFWITCCVSMDFGPRHVRVKSWDK